MADTNDMLKEAIYVAVGLGVLGFQRAQVKRVELTQQLESQLAALSHLTTALAPHAEAQLGMLRDRLRRAFSGE